MINHRLTIFIAIILFAFTSYVAYVKTMESFETYDMYNNNINPITKSSILLENEFPLRGKVDNCTNGDCITPSNKQASDMWWRYPIFKLGSYKQITNNIQFPNNPDEGTCMPDDLCDAIYNDKVYNKKESNYTVPLAPVAAVAADNNAIRVGYFTSNM